MLYSARSAYLWVCTRRGKDSCGRRPRRRRQGLLLLVQDRGWRWGTMMLEGDSMGTALGADNMAIHHSTARMVGGMLPMTSISTLRRPTAILIPRTIITNSNSTNSTTRRLRAIKAIVHMVSFATPEADVRRKMSCLSMNVTGANTILPILVMPTSVEPTGPPVPLILMPMPIRTRLKGGGEGAQVPHSRIQDPVRPQMRTRKAKKILMTMPRRAVRPLPHHLVLELPPRTPIPSLHLPLHHHCIVPVHLITPPLAPSRSLLVPPLGVSEGVWRSR